MMVLQFGFVPLETYAEGLMVGVDGLVRRCNTILGIYIIVGWSAMRSFGKDCITASLFREYLVIVVFRDPLLFHVVLESVSISMLCG
ncbi:unnamed protein product [Ilex paraguariensis]|uniref:Uncharacterized protein n=1 Tax=Ilex paraguariensis TaxID=185542 RepID=A0ABC8UDJ7_9AQUA